MEDRCLASELPSEILLEIFRHISRKRSLDTWEPCPPTPDAWSIARICRAWHGAATEALYHTVSIRTISSAYLFHRTILRRTKLCSCIKVLRLPVDPSVTCPAPVMTMFTRIVNSMESLIALYAPIIQVSSKLQLNERTSYHCTHPPGFTTSAALSLSRPTIFGAG